MSDCDIECQLCTSDGHVLTRVRDMMGLMRAGQLEDHNMTRQREDGITMPCDEDITMTITVTQGRLVF
jgi:hypothetical protein